MFVNHLCEAKGEQYSQADKTQESFCKLVIPSGDASIALDFFEEVFYPVTTPVDPWGKCQVVVRLLRAGMQVFIPLVAAVCLRVELS